MAINRLKTNNALLYFLVFMVFFIKNPKCQNNPDAAIKELKMAIDTTHSDSLKFVCKYKIVLNVVNKNTDQADSMLKQLLKEPGLEKYTHPYLMCLELKANIFWTQGKFYESLEELQIVQRLAEKYKNYHLLTNSYNNMGALYSVLGNIEETKKVFLKGIKVSTEHISYNKQIRGSLVNLYINLAGYETDTVKKMEYLKNAKIMLDTIVTKNPLALYGYKGNYYKVFGKYYTETANYKAALLSFQKSRSFYESGGSNVLTTKVYLAIADMHSRLNNNDSSYYWIKKAEPKLENYGTPEELWSYHKVLAEYYNSKKDYAKAIENLNRYIGIKDSATADDIRNKTGILNSVYQSAKQEEENAKLKTENTVQELQLEKTSAQRNLFIIGGSALFLLAGFLFYNFNQQRKSARVLRDKNFTIEKQNHELYEQKKEITDSIQYSLRLQKNLLPSFLTEQFSDKDGFLIFMPRDIVSGDFYYSFVEKDYKLFLVGDCTGHGVPGAILSVIALEKCKELCENKMNPAEIISELNKHIVSLLGQKNNDEAVNDGMEIACLVYKKKKWLYSGANRPMYILNEAKELLEIKGDKMPISANNDMNITFVETELTLQGNNKVFLLSDGMADQFGGAQDKKLTTKKLKEWLTEDAELSLSEQKHILETKLNAWKKDLQQTDDISLMCIKIS